MKKTVYQKGVTSRNGKNCTLRILE